MTHASRANRTLQHRPVDLAICPHCGRIFAPVAGGACPHCGYPLSAVLERPDVIRRADWPLAMPEPHRKSA